MKTFAERVKFARERLGLSQRALAQLLGITQPGVYRMERSSKSSRQLLQLAEILGVSPEWLQNGTGEIAHRQPTADHSAACLTDSKDVAIVYEEDNIPEGYRSIQALDVQFGAGSRYAVTEFPEEKPRIYPEDFFRRHGLRPENLKAFRLSGESMQPMLQDGCWIVVDTTRTVIIDKRIYALSVGSELMVKQLLKGVDGKIIVNSLSPEYPTQIVDPAAIPVRIHGQVIEYSCMLI